MATVVVDVCYSFRNHRPAKPPTKNAVSKADHQASHPDSTNAGRSSARSTPDSKMPCDDELGAASALPLDRRCHIPRRTVFLRPVMKESLRSHLSHVKITPTVKTARAIQPGIEPRVKSS